MMPNCSSTFAFVLSTQIMKKQLRRSLPLLLLFTVMFTTGHTIADQTFRKRMSIAAVRAEGLYSRMPSGLNSCYHFFGNDRQLLTQCFGLDVVYSGFSEDDCDQCCENSLPHAAEFSSAEHPLRFPIYREF
jgi:hypothetical protein